jgi:tetratricopeptide (TPR) repeat protein
MTCKLDSKSSLGYFNAGLVKNILGDYHGAISDFDIVAEIERNSYLIYHHRGIAKSKAGDIAGACIDWNTACDLGSEISFELIRTHCHLS